MRELTSTEIKAEELKILLEVDIFCKEHNIRYYLVGGTLLGAIRHRGFIPWDDDIDICMPRPDYERFIRTFSSDKGLMVLNKYWNNFTFPYSKVINQRYICDLTYDNSTGNRYIWIDVFPIDGLPHELDTVRAIYRKEDYYRKVLMLNTARLGQGRSGLRMIAKFFLKPFALLYGADRVVKKMEKIASMYKYEDYEIELEEVDGLGIFIEVERLSNDSDEMKVKEEIREFIRSLKLKNVKELNIGKNQYLLSIKMNKKINIYNNTIY